MRRGRPALRWSLRERIQEFLSHSPYPVTVRTVQQGLLKTGTTSAHWCTVKKYLTELVDEGLVVRQALPVQSKRKPLVVYFGRGGKSRAAEDL